MNELSSFGRSRFPMALALALLLSLGPGSGATSEDILLRHLQFLASDELKGRGNHSPELEKAAEYIAAEFRRLALEPAGEEGAYDQAFEMNTGRQLGEHTRLSFRQRGEVLALELNRDYLPLSFGPEGAVRAPLAFAGYGISAPELNYDDYRDIDVRGKVVAIFEGEPQRSSPGSPFGGTDLSPYSTLLHKIMSARNRGAVGLLLLAHPNRREEAEWGSWGGRGSFEETGLHAVRLGRPWSAQLLERSGRDPERILQWLDVQLTPYVFDFRDLEVDLQVDVERKPASLRNVVGLVRGQLDEYIVVGAHYDHLGLGDYSSLAPHQIGQIHYGADDNASGTAALLRLARFWSGKTPRRGIVFAAFSGEELGLLGSRHYVEEPPVPLEKTVTMINLDMIGRSTGSVLIGGTGTAAEFLPVLEEIQRDSPLLLRYSPLPRGSSDHLPFLLKRIPVLFFFSGLHEDYHKPTDTWEKINLERTRQIVEVVHRVLESLVRLEEAPQFVDPRSRPEGTAAEDPRQTVYGPLFGTIPDLEWSSPGVRLAGVLDSGPAARAGLEAGDVLVAFEGRILESFHDFTSALRSRKAGDRVRVRVLRQGRLFETTVTLARREEAFR